METNVSYRHMKINYFRVACDVLRALPIEEKVHKENTTKTKLHSLKEDATCC